VAAHTNSGFAVAWADAIAIADGNSRAAIRILLLDANGNAVGANFSSIHRPLVRRTARPSPAL
jgi:hypothetical protein